MTDAIDSAHTRESISIDCSTCLRSEALLAFMSRSALRHAPSRQPLTVSITPISSSGDGFMSTKLKNGS